MDNGTRVSGDLLFEVYTWTGQPDGGDLVTFYPPVDAQIIETLQPVVTRYFPGDIEVLGDGRLIRLYVPLEKISSDGEVRRYFAAVNYSGDLKHGDEGTINAESLGGAPNVVPAPFPVSPTTVFSSDYELCF